MVLLYLVKENVAVDDEGGEWTREDEGFWQRSSPRNLPQSRLLTSSKGNGDTMGAGAPVSVADKLDVRPERRKA